MSVCPRYRAKRPLKSLAAHPDVQKKDIACETKLSKEIEGSKRREGREGSRADERMQCCEGTLGGVKVGKDHLACRRG